MNYLEVARRRYPDAESVFHAEEMAGVVVRYVDPEAKTFTLKYVPYSDLKENTNAN